MKYKIIALDLDGTLKNSQNQITPKTREALIECSKRGLTVVLASGRPTPGLRHEMNELELQKYGGVLLSFNGARVYDIKNDKVIFEKVVKKVMADEMYDRAKAYGLACMTYDGIDILTEDDNDQYVQVEKRINDMQIRHTDNFKASFKNDVNKVLLTGEPDYVAKIEAEFKAPYQNQLSIYRSAPYFIEIMAQNVDKAASLEKLCETSDSAPHIFVPAPLLAPQYLPLSQALKPLPPHFHTPRRPLLLASHLQVLVLPRSQSHPLLHSLHLQ